MEGTGHTEVSAAEMGCWGVRLLRTVVGSPGYRDAIYGEDPYDLIVISCLAEP